MVTLVYNGPDPDIPRVLLMAPDFPKTALADKTSVRPNLVLELNTLLIVKTVVPENSSLDRNLKLDENLKEADKVCDTDGPFVEANFLVSENLEES
jgi:hypothetical protein